MFVQDEFLYLIVTRHKLTVWFQCEPSWLRLGLHDSIISISISTRAAAIVVGGAFGALFDPLDHRGTSSHVQDNPGAMEALQGAILVHIGAM